MDESLLKANHYPNISYEKKTHLFSTLTKTNNINEKINSIFSNALEYQLKLLKKTSSEFKGREITQVISNSFRQNGNLTWTNKDMSNMDINQVVECVMKDVRIVFPKA